MKRLFEVFVKRCVLAAMNVDCLVSLYKEKAQNPFWLELESHGKCVC